MAISDALVDHFRGRSIDGPDDAETTSGGSRRVRCSRR